jgi:hypothetical protein
MNGEEIHQIVNLLAAVGEDDVFVYEGGGNAVRVLWVRFGGYGGSGGLLFLFSWTQLGGFERYFR